MEKPMRILHFPGTLRVGGVGSLVINIYRNIDRKSYQLDFCVVRADNGDGPFDEEIKHSGGKIFNAPQLKKVGILKYINSVKQIIKENGPYDAVHIHSSVFNGVFILLISKFLGVKNRIYHAHSTKDSNLNRIPFPGLFKSLARFIIKTFSSNYIACGIDAAKYAYGNNYANNRVLILNNALDLNHFYPFDESSVKEIRNEFDIPQNTFVIGNAARFVQLKNQKYLINLTNRITKEHDVVLLLAGEGETRIECEKYAKELGIAHIVKFLGNISDMPKFYNALDIFILPSLFEGLPVSSIESQACGIPCLQSDTITTETDMGLGLLYNINLQENLNKVLEICKIAKDARVYSKDLVRSALKNKEYEISETVNTIKRVYNNAN